MPANLKWLTRENKFPNDYPTKYTVETLKIILEYIKDEKFLESIESLRKPKNDISITNEYTKKNKKSMQVKFDNAETI